jgi:S1-C subfamily serine protease
MDPVTTTCGNCHSPMPRELRFCRNCGFRLGEGSAEYTETVRFQNAPPGTLPGNGAAGFHPDYAGPMSVASGRNIGKRRRRMSGMTWIFICLLIFFVGGGMFSAIIKPIRDNVHVQFPQMPSRSYAGVDSFQTTDGGVTFGTVEAPGSPADKAGLVGGDIITAVDGQPVHSDDELASILRHTPIGNTLDIVYLRDGESRNTKLTTISKAELDSLNRDFRDRPEGIGRFGYNDDNSERVEIPGTKMFGVKLNELNESLPAIMAGIKQGDIVIEFDKIPIRTPEELRSRVRRALPYVPVDVVVMRGPDRITIPVKMGKQD